MSDNQQRYIYPVCGFGDHVQCKTVEFVERLDELQVCSWCGGASADTKVLSCWHLICEECHLEALNDANPECLVDKQTLQPDFTGVFNDVKNVLTRLKVRCLHADRGCDFDGSLYELNTHLESSCAMNLTTCSKCEQAVAHKDMKDHIPLCKGMALVVLGRADARPLLEDLRNARKEVEHALNAVSSVDRDALKEAINSLTEQLDALASQLSPDAHRSVETPSSVDPCRQ
ncbi:hypothetical protein V5799_005760 [Amblyomma americanum]|uniref:Uncharacterized protein n=1 Tax=Amblyomma americanum TaxID=6943 RepID=A0AAQ4DYB9_AMBAM